MAVTKQDEQELLRIQRERKLIEKVETFVSEVKSFGPFQIGFIIATQLHSCAIAPFFFVMSFGTMPPTATCSDPGMTNITDLCTVVQSCQNFTLIPAYGFHSMMIEWPHLIEQACTGVDPLYQLVTANELMGGLSYMLGGVLAGVIGRKYVILGGAILGSLFGFLTCYSTSFGMFAACLILNRMAYCNCWNAMSLLSEYTLNKYRLMMNFSQNWCFTMVIAAAWAYYTQNFRTFLLAGAVLGIPLAAIYSLYPESPRWLIAERKYARASTALNCMATVNRRKVRYTEWTINDQLSDLIAKDGEAIKVSPLYSLKSVLRLFTNKKLGVLTVVVTFQFFMNGATASMFIYNMADLVTSPYVTIGLLGLMRMWCPFVAVAVDQFVPNFKRKLFLALSYIGVVLPLCISTICAILSYFEMGDKQSLEMTLSISALIALSMNYGILWFAFSQIVAEAYPTVVRAGAMAFTCSFGFVGSACGPFIIMLQTIWRPLNYVVVTVVYSICFLLGMLVMPETKGKPLPDNFDDLQFVFKPNKK